MKNYILLFALLAMPLLADDDEPHQDSPSKDAAAQVDNKCADPSMAVSKIIGGGLEKTACFEKSNYSSRELIVVAEHLIAVLKTHKITIDPKSVPREADYKDPNTEQSRYYLFASDRPIYLEKFDQRWLIPDEAVDNINLLYKESLKFNVSWFYSVMPRWMIHDIVGIDDFNALNIALLIAFIIIAFAVRFAIASVLSWHVGKLFERLDFLEHQRVVRKASYALASLIAIGILTAAIPSLDINVHISHYLILALRFLAGVAAVALVFHSVDILTMFLYRRAENSEGKFDSQLVPLFGKIFKIVVVLLGGIFVLQNLDVDVTSLLAGFTIGGLAFSFAAKDAVANFFGSVTIFSDRSFSLGDTIKINGVEGKVETIGFRSTRLRTDADSLIIMPNSKFTDEMVENLSARRKRRTAVTLLLTQKITAAQIEAFCNGVRAIIKAHPSTRKDGYLVNFDGISEEALKIFVVFFTATNSKTVDYQTRHEIFLDTWRLAEKMGVHFAFPSHDTHVFLHDSKPPVVDDTRTNQQLEEIAGAFAPSGSSVIAPGPRMGEAYLAEPPQLRRKAR